MKNPKFLNTKFISNLFKKVAIDCVALMFVGFFLPKEIVLLPPKANIMVELLKYSIKVTGRTDSEIFERNESFILGRVHFGNASNISVELTLNSDAKEGYSWEKHRL